MRFNPATGFWIGLCGLLGGAYAPAEAACSSGDCVLVWEDNFNGTAVDTTKWEFMLGNGCSYGICGWGNNELQNYTAENATVADGVLTITAEKEPDGSYTSARLRTFNKGDWTYGRFEMRAKLPVGQGIWPAFWMLPTDSPYGTWAAGGEIDIMEIIGSEPSRIHGTIHYGGVAGGDPPNTFTGDSYVLPGNDPTEFHIYAVEWEQGEIRWYVDGVLYSTQTSWWSTGGPYPAPFDVDFHLLLNLAVGGNWPKDPDDTTVFPQKYVIDYVRVYELPANRVFDDMEHANPFGNDWFVFNDYGVGNGTLNANGTDLPPENGGNASLQTDWSSGGTAGYFGGFGRSRLLSIPDDVSEFHFWINPDPGQNFTLAINLQEDDNSDGAPDEEFQYDCTVSNSTSACAMSGGGWQLVRIPLTDFYKDTSFLTGGNGTFDPASGGNGALTHVVMAIISNSSADVSFRTDYWAFYGEQTDTDADGSPDIVDADDDNDGIGDELDNKPLEPDNACEGETNAVFSQQVTGPGPVTCAASASITVISIAEVLAEGNLRLIAPIINLGSGFDVAGSMTVISADPCPGCASQ